MLAVRSMNQSIASSNMTSHIKKQNLPSSHPFSSLKQQVSSTIKVIPQKSIEILYPNQKPWALSEPSCNSSAYSSSGAPSSSPTPWVLATTTVYPPSASSRTWYTDRLPVECKNIRFWARDRESATLQADCPKGGPNGWPYTMSILRLNGCFGNNDGWIYPQNE